MESSRSSFFVSKNVPTFSNAEAIEREMPFSTISESRRLFSFERVQRRGMRRKDSYHVLNEGTKSIVNYSATMKIVGFMHQDQFRELQYFRNKKRKVDSRPEELEAEVAKIRAKQKKVTARLDEFKQMVKALEILSEDWEKVDLQLVWPMPYRLLRDNHSVSNRAI
ncbi:unnamed protein product [Arabidopsis thaliana]|uniref:(thale cress) hypothetical protein n=1 Tax=Arabidopsis thaliana TaxID=3702 RepID=A0A7G2FEX4_ARATH|nr:unnamed protein product [Arabidopsis thaliana]